MKTAEKLLVHLAEHVRELPPAVGSLTLRLPIRGIDDASELRRAVQEAQARGYLEKAVETTPGVFVASVSKDGAEVFAPK
jgi:hypothetical protein